MFSRPSLGVGRWKTHLVQLRLLEPASDGHLLPPFSAFGSLDLALENLLEVGQVDFRVPVGFELALVADALGERVSDHSSRVVNHPLLFFRFNF